MARANPICLFRSYKPKHKELSMALMTRSLGMPGAQ
jgi:hypothetical protein